jgi:two-component system phosphate regulon sensor histidine kinase PhoR
VPLQLAPTAVADLLLIPTSRLREQADRNNIEFVVDIAPGLPNVLADTERVQRVVTNLLHNAVKFTPEGGRIIVSAYRDENEPDTIVFSVKDNGIGITKEEIDRIFERFYKSDRARTRGQGGTGLGLAISRHIVQAHQGRIWVKSKENKGSTFSFSLPVG